MSFSKLEVNGEEIPEGQSVKIVRDRSSWWVQPAGPEAYIIAAIIIALAVAAAILVS